MMSYNLHDGRRTITFGSANWIAASLYDLETANHMLATERYLYVIFMCHLVPTRYPDDLQRAIQVYSKSVAEEYLAQTKEVLKWLQAPPNLQDNSNQS